MFLRTYLMNGFFINVLSFYQEPKVDKYSSQANLLGRWNLGFGIRSNDEMRVTYIMLDSSDAIKNRNAPSRLLVQKVVGAKYRWSEKGPWSEKVYKTEFSLWQTN